MKWQFGRKSDNVEDQRGNSVSGGTVIGGGIGTLVLAVVILLLGGDPTALLQQSASTPAPAPVSTSGSGDKIGQFVAVVLADTEDTWTEIFQQLGKTYQPPKLVLFSRAVASACGNATAAVGPFYCPSDRKVYLDTQFFQDLQNKYQAPGDFAEAYVIAHEVGHHVQNLLGISRQVEQMQQRSSQVQANKLSVSVELQADCFAGVWANHANNTRQILEPGDLEEALQAASQIGDDRLQKQAQGYVVPDSFTHGSSTQRVQWFRRGFASGSLQQCNTFSSNKNPLF